MVLAIAFALRGFNREVGKDTSNTEKSSGENTVVPPADMAIPEVKILAGFVSEVISKKDSTEKWIELSVTIPENVPTEMPGPKVKPSTIPIKTKTNRYLFYLDAKTGTDIKGGERATISFYGEPSETEYQSVEKVEITQQ